MLSYKRRIHVYETDLMGIVHHSNYLRFCEEARVEWFRANGFDTLTQDEIFGLVVVETRVQHKRAIRYFDSLQIDLQIKSQGAKIMIQYRLYQEDKIFALAETIHCRIDQNFKVLRLDQKVTQLMEKEKWTETWL
jgi:acyl-CoA thioester hydrolase